MKAVLYVAGVLIKILAFLITPLTWIRKARKRRTVPTTTEKMLTISATDLAEKIRRKEIRSVEICTAYVNRIRQVNPYVNAIVEERFESALRDAKNVDDFLATYTGSVEELATCRPLLGVPLTVKESCSLAGYSLSVGVRERCGIKAHRDGDAVSLLKSAGAIPLAVTNTPDLCMGWETRNPITGATSNPYNLDRTSGGSSGGEGALLGSAGSLIGLGSDIAGSIRLPAMFNGVFGHKPSPRVVSLEGHFPLPPDERNLDYNVIGPLCRYAKDLRLMLKILSREDLKLDDLIDMKQLKVFYSFGEKPNLARTKVSTDIVKVLEKSVDYLKNQSGATVIRDRKIEETDDIVEMCGSLLYSLEGIPNLLNSEKQNLALELVKCLIGRSQYSFNLLLFYLVQHIYDIFITNDSYFQRHEDLKKEITKMLSENGVLLYPTFPESAFPHKHFMIYPLSVTYLMIFNTLGLPSTHVPCGFDSNGLPIGIQVVAGPKQDRLCLRVAEELEKCFGGWIRPA